MLWESNCVTILTATADNAAKATVRGIRILAGRIILLSPTQTDRRWRARWRVTRASELPASTERRSIAAGRTRPVAKGEFLRKLFAQSTNAHMHGSTYVPKFLRQLRHQHPGLPALAEPVDQIGR